MELIDFRKADLGDVGNGDFDHSGGRDGGSDGW